MAKQVKQNGPEKPLAVRIPTDDFAVEVPGQGSRHTHRGEWVEIWPIIQVWGLDTTTRYTELRDEMNELSESETEDPAESAANNAKAATLMARMTELMREITAYNLVDWSWTDNWGRPMPKPDGTVAPLSKLGYLELSYLIGLRVNPDTEDEGKNA